MSANIVITFFTFSFHYKNILQLQFPVRIRVTKENDLRKVMSSCNTEKHRLKVETVRTEHLEFNGNLTYLLQPVQ